MELTRPNGTPFISVVFIKLTAKFQQRALKSPVRLLGIVHPFPGVVCTKTGVGAFRVGMVNIRISAPPTAPDAIEARVAFNPKVCCSGSHMFDCPEQIQTSPNVTLVI